MRSWVSPRRSRARACFPVLAAACLASTVACRTHRNEEPNRTATQPPLLKRHPTPAAPRGARPASACQISAFVDLRAARDAPRYRLAMKRFIDQRDKAHPLAERAAAEVERYARTAQLCEIDTVDGKASRAIAFGGTFPPDFLDSLSSKVSGLERLDSPRGRVLKKRGSFIGRGADGLIWADREETFERAVRNQLFDPDLPRASMLAVRMSRRRAKVAFTGFMESAGLDANAWHSVLLTVSKDGKSTEFGLLTPTRDTVAPLLDMLREFVKELSANPRTSDIVERHGLSAEATDRGVSLRSQAPLDQFLAMLAVLPRRIARAGSHP